MQLDVDLQDRGVVVVGTQVAARRVIRRYRVAGARLTAVLSGPQPTPQDRLVDVRYAGPPAAGLGSDWFDLLGAAWLVVLVGAPPAVDAQVREVCRQLRIAVATEPAATTRGQVTLVGGGPGLSSLLTVQAVAALRDADVVFYDRLAPTAELAELAPDAELVDVGKQPHHHPVGQRDIEAQLVSRAQQGATVVRLKGGDPFVFGRGGEEVEACVRAGIPVRVVPGISSALSVPATVGVPLTHRGISRAFTVISGHDPLTPAELAALAQLDATLVILMGVGNALQITAGLVRAGMDPGIPAAAIERGFSSTQRTTVAPLGELAAEMRRVDVRSPAVIVIGDVVRLADGCGAASSWSGLAQLAYGGPSGGAVTEAAAGRPPGEQPALRVDQLRGFRIGVTSDRRADDLVAALQRRGAEVLHAPALSLAPQGDDAPLLEQTRAVIDARPDVVLVTTGYGMRRWLDAADAAGLGAELIAVLEEADVLARGPKALGAVRAAGLDDADASEGETTACLVDRVLQRHPPGVRVAVQLHGTSDDVQLRRLSDFGAEVHTVTPYRWVPPRSPDRLTRLVEAVCRHELDAITFTSAPAVHAVLTTARGLDLLEPFCAALRGDVLAAAVGPVTAEPLRELGLQPVVPDRFRMGALIRLVCDQLQRDRVLRLRGPGVQLELAGRCLQVTSTAGSGSEEGGSVRTVMLAPSALAMLRLLAASPGVVPRDDLVRCLPDGRDTHALEVAVSRLRRAVGVPGLIRTVVKRGYRLDAEPVRPPGR